MPRRLAPCRSSLQGEGRVVIFPVHSEIRYQKEEIIMGIPTPV
jgi:hypothetical protein